MPLFVNKMYTYNIIILLILYFIISIYIYIQNYNNIYNYNNIIYIYNIAMIFKIIKNVHYNISNKYLCK